MNTWIGIIYRNPGREFQPILRFSLMEDVAALQPDQGNLTGAANNRISLAKVKTI